MTKQTVNFNLNEKQCESQKSQILNVLLCRGKLTALDALRYFGCLRLPSRIDELRKDGFPIQTKMIQVGGKWVAEYSI